MRHTGFWYALLSACIFGVTLFGTAAARSSENIALAEAFTAALNDHDVDAVVAMFTEEDSGPTVIADRYAWQKYEIRLWAIQQAAANVHAVAYDLRETEHGVEWTAQLTRDDFRALGLEYVTVTNTLWVHNGLIADFTSVLADPRDEKLLRGLWRPSQAPDYRVDI